MGVNMIEDSDSCLMHSLSYILVLYVPRELRHGGQLLHRMSQDEVGLETKFETRREWTKDNLL